MPGRRERLASLLLAGGLWTVLIAGALEALLFNGGFVLARLRSPSFVMPADFICFRMNAALIQGYHFSLAEIQRQGCVNLYPPPFLLLTAPLIWLSPKWAVISWSLFGIALISVAGRVAGYCWRAIAMGLLSPPSLYCLTTGQTGEIMSGLLLLSLALAEANPVLAGIAAGCMAVKPQFALLLPVCFMAARRWRAVIAAALTALTIGMASIAIFGFAPWRDFVQTGMPMARTILEWSWPKDVQIIMISVFIMMRSLGAGLTLAYAVQTAAALGAVAAAWAVWRPQARLEMPTRLLITLCLVPLATPYGYLYDIPGLALALAAAFVNDRQRYLAPVALFWFVTGFYMYIAIIGFVAGGILLALLAIGVWSWSTKRPAAALPAEG